MQRIAHALTALTFLLFLSIPLASAAGDMQWLAVHTPDKFARSQLVDMGVNVEQVVDDTSYGFAPASIVEKVRQSSLQIQSVLPASRFHADDFPPRDSIYHTYSQLVDSLHALEQKNPKLVHLFSVGKSLEGRDLWAIRLNPDVTAGNAATVLTLKPGIVFMGGHHAREHLSIEIPLMMAEHLVANYGVDAEITRLLNSRDIFFIPSVNPDGSEFDIATGEYQMWRKNRAGNGGNDCAGVDLNRNYGFEWGTGGSSSDPCSEIYMGPKAFSEPETQAMKKFVEDRPNLKVLLSFHTYSELVLYPWGHTYDLINRGNDHAAFEKMAQTMAGWNGYTPEQSSSLYITSGDTTDWAYGTLGIFAFTFELSPKSALGGRGFYPGPGAIQYTFDANLKPVLYLIDLADNPLRSVSAPSTTMFYGSF